MLDDNQKKQYTQFLKWYAMPETVREPRNIPEYCEISGITQADIFLFREQENFATDLVQLSVEWGRTKIPELIGILYESAKATKNISNIKAIVDIVSANDKKAQLKSEQESEKQQKTASLRELFTA